MNRRNFLAAAGGSALGLGALAATQPITKTDARGPYSIEIVSPPEEKVRELPLFDSYKQAENFAQARMHILRCNYKLTNAVKPEDIGTKYAHEAGLIKVWSADSQVLFECSWGETWTMSKSYVDVNGRLA
jgi:hypothetical protein